LAERQHAFAEKWKTRQAQVQQALVEVEKRRAALDRLHAEATLRHREAIEMRLAAGELWQELTRQAPSVELTRSLSALRMRLAESFRAESVQLAEQTAELRELAGRLDMQHERLMREQAEWRAKQAEQERHIELQAKALVERDRQLDQQAQQAALEQSAWIAERRELQQRLRERLTRIRELESSEARLAPAA
jgi:hypothetical protein